MRWKRPIFVWFVWAGMVVAALLFVGRYGRNVPYYDDWSLVYVLGGERPVDVAWLWEPRNGHRIALPKLMLLGLHAITGWDFRAGMYASVILLSAASSALIRAGARSRGSTSYADAVFPLLLLNWGHYDNLIWGWQLTQVLPVALGCLLLAAVARWNLDPPFPIAVLASIGLVALPLSGAPGLACTPGFALWLLAVGRREWLRGPGEPRRRSLVIWSITGLAVSLVPVYFVGLHDTRVPPLDAVRSAKAVLSFLAHGFGPAAVALIPWSLALTSALFAAGTIFLVEALRQREPGRRSRAWALSCALIAFAGLAVSAGIARPLTFFPHRYFLMAVPALCWLYLTADLSRRQGVAGAARASLLVLSLLAGVYNTSAGLAHARTRSAAVDAFEAEVRAGLPPSELIARHQRTLMPFPEEGGAYAHGALALRFDVLRRAGVGVFAALAPDPAFREANVDDIAKTSYIDDPQGPFTGWIWKLAEARQVAGIRIMRNPQLQDGGADAGAWTLEWARSASEPFSVDRRYVHWWMESEITATVWIYDRIAILRLALPTQSTTSSAPQLHLLIEADDE